MIHEQRTYNLTTAPMMEHLHERMESKLIPLFEEFDIKTVGAWEVLIGPNLPRYTYLLEWRDLQHRQEAFEAFYADGRWPEIRRESVERANNEIVASLAAELWTPADYSPMR